jgi:hypothetical protein
MPPSNTNKMHSNTIPISNTNKMHSNTMLPSNTIPHSNKIPHSNTNKMHSNTMLPSNTKKMNSKNLRYNDLKLRYEGISYVIIMQIQIYISLKKKIKSLLKIVKNTKESANLNRNVSSIESGVGMGGIGPVYYN